MALPSSRGNLQGNAKTTQKNVFEVLRSSRLVQGKLLKCFSSGGFGFLDIKLVVVTNAKKAPTSGSQRVRKLDSSQTYCSYIQINACMFAMTLGILTNVYKARCDGSPLKSAPGWATKITSCS